MELVLVKLTQLWKDDQFGQKQLFCLAKAMCYINFANWSIGPAILDKICQASKNSALKLSLQTDMISEVQYVPSKEMIIENRAK